jgi:hypothetical protein
MSERVSIIEGKQPILLVAPHGFNGDDENTALLAEEIAYLTNAYVVVNKGWERDEKVDYLKDKADCNNILHCHEDVVREEFLDPILRFRNRILRKHPIVHMYMLHGMSNRHRKICHDPTLDMVIGFGAGTPNSYTCDLWRKNCFIHLLENDAGFTVYEGKPGGQMSGWSKNNMNQLFRKWYDDPQVQSMQIEIIHELRADREMTQLTAEYLASAMLDLIEKLGFKSSKQNKQY